MFEVLTECGKSHRAAHFISEFCRQASPYGVHKTSKYTGDEPWLVVWGIGGRIQARAAKKHIEAGGHVLCADIGYFDRSKDYKDSCFRISIDHPHPQKYYRPEKLDRWDSLGIPLREYYKPDGHVIICGLGPKSRKMLGYEGLEWEESAYKQVKHYHGGRVFYRPKPRTSEWLPGCLDGSTGEIEELLRGASLVVCRHSNVALDATICGVPVVCTDGIASAVYGNHVGSAVKLPKDKRLELLGSAAYWNWKPSEISQMLEYLDERSLLRETQTDT